jgi:hypothetical protein
MGFAVVMELTICCSETTSRVVVLRIILLKLVSWECGFGPNSNPITAVQTAVPLLGGISPTPSTSFRGWLCCWEERLLEAPIARRSDFQKEQLLEGASGWRQFCRGLKSGA